jgi:hypothetical protein
MNELAQLVHDLVTRGQEPSEHLCSELAPEERAALEDLKVLLAESPSRLAALLVQLGPTAEWFGPSQSARNSAQP